MRELSIEEKARAYDKAIERANDILKGYDPKEDSKATINYIFPELNKSEDERIREALIDYFNKYKKQVYTFYRIPTDNILAWLKKQDKKEFTFKSIPRLLEMIEPTDRAKSYCQKLIDSLVKEGYTADAKIVGECLKQMNGEKVAMAVMDKKPIIIIPKFRVGDEIVTKNEESLTITRIDEEGYWSNDLFICGFNDSDEWEIVEQKPYGQRKECLDCQFNYAGECKGSCAMKRSEQDQVNKVKLKFKVGDWIVNNISKDVFLIKSANSGYYTLEDIKGNIISPCLPPCEDATHLWTLQDAKPGDVLREDSCTFIIQELYNNNTLAKTYCTLYDDGDFDDGSTLSFDVDSTHPATKEQRDFLFQKMKESGYEWDANNKELNKIHIIDEGKVEIDHCFTKMMNGEKVSSTWSEEDEKRLKSCLNILQPKSLLGNVETINTKWLKSIRNRITWKPRDEQMNAFEQAYNWYNTHSAQSLGLNSLYYDLKKLKGE